MKTIAVGKFKQLCLQLLEEVRQTGQPILITKRGRPLAQVVPVQEMSTSQWRGCLKDQGTIVGDILSPASELEDWEVLRK